jgi:hypothetical protein
MRVEREKNRGRTETGVNMRPRPAIKRRDARHERGVQGGTRHRVSGAATIGGGLTGRATVVLGSSEKKRGRGTKTALLAGGRAGDHG